MLSYLVPVLVLGVRGPRASAAADTVPATALEALGSLLDAGRELGVAEVVAEAADVLVFQAGEGPDAVGADPEGLADVGQADLPAVKLQVLIREKQ